MIELKGICGGVCMSNYGKIEELKAPNKTMSMVVLAMALVYNVIFGFIRNPAERIIRFPGSAMIIPMAF